MYKSLIALLTVYVCYRSIIYIVLPFYSFDDYTTLIISATESIVIFLALTGVLYMFTLKFSMIFNPFFYTSHFQLSVLEVDEEEVNVEVKIIAIRRRERIAACSICKCKY